MAFYHGILMSTQKYSSGAKISVGGTDRLLRHLAANRMLQKSPSGAFLPTTFTHALLEPVFGEWINYL